VSSYEYMLIDNVGDRAKRAIIDAAKHSFLSGFVGLRTSADLADMAHGYNIGDVQRQMPRLITHFNYAGSVRD